MKYVLEATEHPGPGDTGSFEVRYVESVVYEDRVQNQDGSWAIIKRPATRQWTEERQYRDLVQRNFILADLKANEMK